MPSVQAFSVALLVGASAFATPILGGNDIVKSLVGDKSISDILRNNHGQSNNWKKHPAFNSVCSTLENPQVLLDNVRRGDWTSCSEQSLREDWKQLLESCCESRKHEGESKGEHGDEHDNKPWENKPWDDGKKYECKSIEESRRFLESIKKNDYSECPKELEHDEWKKHVEACCEEEKEWTSKDDEWKGENDDDEDKEWDGEDKELDGKDGKDGEWKGGKDDEHHGKKCTTIEESRRLHELIKKEDYSECPKEFEHEEWKKFIEECCEEEKAWSKDDEHHGKLPLPRVPEHTCIPSKHLPKDYSGMTVETWLSTLNYEHDIIHERSQFNSVMLD